MKRYIPVYIVAAPVWACLAVRAWPQAREVYAQIMEVKRVAP